MAIPTLVGTPTAGAFVPTFTQEHFDHLIIFTGVLLLSSAALMGAAHKIEGRSTIPASDSETGNPWVCELFGSSLQILGENTTY